MSGACWFCHEGEPRAAPASCGDRVRTKGSRCLCQRECRSRWRTHQRRAIRPRAGPRSVRPTVRLSLGTETVRPAVPRGNEVKSVNCRSLRTNPTTVAFEVFGTSRVSLGVLLPFAAILAAGSEDIGVGAGALDQIDSVVIPDELC
jgi:hypothetical protein